MARFLGLEFAPMTTSIERRLQTAVILVMILFMMTAGSIGSFGLLYLLTTKYYWITCLYLVWWVYDRKTCEQGGRRWRGARNWAIWRYFRDYFPMKLVKTADLDPSKNYIFGCHPHGIISLGVMCNLGTEANNFSQVFPGIRATVLTLVEQFAPPLHRESVMVTGTCAASRESMEWLLTKEGTGNALVLVPGGAAEALDAIPGELNLTLASRKGFIRIALKHGADLVPVFSFGENEVYQQERRDPDSMVRRVQRKMTKMFRVSPPIFHGRGIFQYTFGLLPYRNPITTVVGAPIKVDKVLEPTKEQVDELHKKYCASLLKFYDEHKAKYGFEKIPLNII